MANPLRGEVMLGSVKLRFTINAICEFEGRTGKAFLDVANELGDTPSIVTLREFIWLGGKSSYPEMTIEAAGDLMDEVGFDATLKALGDALRAAFPPASAEATAEKN